MNAKFTIVALGLAAIGSGAASSAAASPARDVQQTVKQFTLRDGEAHRVADSKQMETYRVCYEQASNNREGFEGVETVPTPRDVGLRIVADGQTSTISAGDCANMQAKVVSVSPAGRLGIDEVLVGHIEHLG